MLATANCCCSDHDHDTKRVVVTGGPGAGKTALLEIARRHFCGHVLVLPEAASIVYGGGFPRQPELAWRRAAQRAIYHVQSELEQGATEAARPAVLLCDRGTLDGAAYWPDGPEDWATALRTSLPIERARYSAVIQLRTPSATSYDHVNPLRIESPADARAIDERIDALWAGHARHHVVASTPRFLDKVQAALEAIEAEVPPCCRR